MVTSRNFELKIEEMIAKNLSRVSQKSGNAKLFNIKQNFGRQFIGFEICDSQDELFRISC